MGEDKARGAEQGSGEAGSAVSEAARLLAVAAHDLRTPLGAMTAIMDLLDQTDLDSEQRDLLSRLRAAGDYLRDLSDELISVDRSQFLADREHRNFNPAETLETLTSLYRAQADAMGVSLTGEIDPELNNCYAGFPLALQRIVGNLLDNAVKFTGEGAIAVNATPGSLSDRQSLIVHVRDQGPGMASHEVERLFLPFKQGKAGRESRKGSGLGLWISYQLANALGGSLSAESMEGHGTTMRLELPLFPPHSDQPVRELPAGEIENYRTCIAGKSVLALDDNPASREILVSVLESFGMTVVPASTGEEALELAGKSPFDVFVLDLNLPGKSGVEVARQLQDRGNHTKSVFFALTAGMRPDVARDYEKANFDSLVDKPFAVKTLFEELGRLLSDKDRA